MIDAFVLVIIAIIVSPVLFYAGVAPEWLAGIVIIAMIPTLYGMITGGPFVPSKQERIKNMFALAKIKKGDTVYDLGCGDGRIVQAAARKGAIATGYEISIGAWIIAKIRCAFTKNCHIYYGNFWQKDFADADTIFCYLLGPTMRRFAEEIWPKLQKGTRVISNGFPITTLPETEVKDKVYLYVKD